MITRNFIAPTGSGLSRKVSTLAHAESTNINRNVLVIALLPMRTQWEKLNVPTITAQQWLLTEDLGHHLILVDEHYQTAYAKLIPALNRCASEVWMLNWQTRIQQCNEPVADTNNIITRQGKYLSGVIV